MMIDENENGFEPSEEKTGSGGILAIGLLILAIILLIFIYRNELGIGTPEVDLAVPEDIGVEAPPPAPAPATNDMTGA